MEKINIVKKLVEDYKNNNKNIFKCMNEHAMYMYEIINYLKQKDFDEKNEKYLKPIFDIVRNAEKELNSWDKKISECYEKLKSDGRLIGLVDDIYSNSIYYYKNLVRLEIFEESIRPLLTNKYNKAKKLQELNLRTMQINSISRSINREKSKADKLVRDILDNIKELENDIAKEDYSKYNKYLELIKSYAISHSQEGNQKIIFGAIEKHCKNMFKIMKDLANYDEDDFDTDTLDDLKENLEEKFKLIIKQEKCLELWREDFNGTYGYNFCIKEIEDIYDTDKLAELVEKLYDNSFETYDQECFKIKDLNKRLRFLNVNENDGTINKIEISLIFDNLNFLSNKIKEAKKIIKNISNLKNNFKNATNQLLKEIKELKIRKQ